MINRYCFQIRINGNFGGALAVYAENEENVEKTVDRFCEKYNFKRDQLILKNVRPANKKEIERIIS